MCVNCNIRTEESVSSSVPQNMVVRADSELLTIDYPLSWVSSMVVTSRAEPYGTPLFETGNGVSADSAPSVLGKGIYVAKAHIGAQAYGSTHCSLHIRSDGSAPFVRVHMQRPDFYR